MRPGIFSFIIAALLFGIVTTGCSAKPALHGGVINSPLSAPEIRMDDQNGNTFQLSALHGKIVLVFFGFTNCVEECPLTMAHLKVARQELGEDAGNVQVVMVSTDPFNDTRQAMQDFLGKFDPGFIGIPGTQEQLSKLWKDYGVVVLDGGETHSSFTYVVDLNGKIRETFDPQTTPEDMASDLKILLSEK